MSDIHSRVVGSVGAALLLVDRQGRVLFCNTPAIRMLGRDLAGVSLTEGLFEEDLPLVPAVASRYRLARERAGAMDELLPIQGDDGQPRLYWASMTTGAADSTADPGERALMILDATDLLASAATVRTVFSQVNHDLRSPLTSIGGATELLMSGRVGEMDAMQRRLLGIVEESVKKMAEILARTKARLAERQAMGNEENA